MPTWKIEDYWFYFRAGEPLKKHEPAHIHVRGAKRGKIQFWLEKKDTKSKNEVEVKEIKGVVSKEEQNEIERLVKKNRNKFLKEWEFIQRSNRRKEKAVK